MLQENLISLTIATLFKLTFERKKLDLEKRKDPISAEINFKVIEVLLLKWFNFEVRKK